MSQLHSTRACKLCLSFYSIFNLRNLLYLIFLGRAKDCPAGGRTRASLLCKYKKSACQWQADFQCWRYLSSRPVTRQVLSAKVSLTSVFGMGTGGPSPQSTPTRRNKLHIPRLGLKSKARSFRCSSSQNHNRFAGLRFCRGTWIYPEN